jgi:hypothetical protein
VVELCRIMVDVRKHPSACSVGLELGLRKTRV